MRRVFFFFLLFSVGTLTLCLDQPMAAEDMVVAVDKSTMLKAIGLGIMALLAELWRGQRSLYKITTNQGKQIQLIKGYCSGKNGECGLGGDDES